MTLKRFVCTAIAAIAALCARAADKPNIIYIMLDDAGMGDFSCYGQKKFKTPNIDRIATEGMKFSQHYSGSTVCAPSRCALMTGLHTGHAYVRGNKEHRPVGQEPIPDSAVTIAEILKNAGYATGGYGKWGLGYPGSCGDPIKQGFDEFYGYYCQRNAHNYYPDHLFHNGKKVELDGKTYSHDLIAAKALDFIRRNKDRKFFCYLPVTIPHAAMHVPEKYSKPWREKLPQFENKIGKYAGPKVINPIAAFAGMMTKVDETVGQVLDLVKDLGIDDNTIIMLTSDNGAHLEGGHDPRFWDSNGPLRGFKRNLTDGGIRTPMLARWPGKIKPGSTTDHISAFWDVMPTFCELVGQPIPSGTDGISFLPTLLGQLQKKHKYLYWEFRGKQAVRLKQWKGIGSPDNIQLYDVVADIGESKDLAKAHPEVVSEIRAAMLDAHVDSTLFPLKGKPKKKRKKK